MAEDMFVVNGGADGKEEEEKMLMDGVAVLDFDMLCSAVAAMQTQGKCKWTKLDNQEDHEDSEFGGGGVLRMWEGDLLNCLDDRSIALESACCPCYRFGKNMRRAGFGFCFIQGIVYMILVVAALVNMMAFIVTRRHCFLYLCVAFTISVGAYLGFYRKQITKKFNIRGNDSLLDDCLYHLVCPCCTLSQESRTLEMNNVQDGTWHGRGDTICVGAYNEGSKGNFELSSPPVISIMSPAEVGPLLDDCLYHLVCPCCTLSQESRTLEMNNVQDGTWHGRGDTICVGAYYEGSKGNFELSAPPVISITSPEPSMMVVTQTAEVYHSASLAPPFR